MRTKLLVALCAVAVGACISCDNTMYRIAMTPHGDQMTRQLDMTRNGASSAPVTRPVGPAATQPYEGAFPVEMVQRIAGQYSQGHEIAQNQAAFLGEFTHKMPDDVGNLGHYQVFTDPMGTANVYLEQFRGQSEQAPNVQRVQESAGTLADLFTGYLRQNLSGDPSWPAFETFLKGAFRDDLRNLALDLYIARAAGTICTDSDAFQPGMDKWLLIRSWQFMLERGYSSLEDLPAFKAIGNEELVGPNILQRIVGRKMGIPADQWEKRLACLGNMEQVGKGFVATIESSDSFKQWKRQQEAASQSATSKPASHPYTMEPSGDETKDMNPDAFVGKLANVIMFAPTYPTPDALDLTMSLPGKPVSTNGEWDSLSGKIKWSAAMPVGTNLPLPVICYAIWSEANVDFQHHHFGRIALQGQDLYDYVMWTKTLSRENAKAWQEMLEKTEPETAIAKVEGFRFRDDPKMVAAAGTQPATLPAGKATAWTQKIAEMLKKPLNASMFERTLE